MEQDPTQPKRVCKNCKIQIPEALFSIHASRCLVNQTAKNKQKPKKQGKKKGSRSLSQIEPQKQEKKEQIKPPPQPQKKEQEERFPCYMCDYQQRLEQLDTHFKNCPNRQTPCPHCQIAFPLSLINEHKVVCPRRPGRQRVAQQPRPVVPQRAPTPAPVAPLNRSESQAGNTSSPPLFIRPAPSNNIFMMANRGVNRSPRRSQLVNLEQLRNSANRSRENSSSNIFASRQPPSLINQPRAIPRPPRIYQSFQDSQNQESSLPQPNPRVHDLLRRNVTREELNRLNEVTAERIRMVAARFDQRNNGGLKERDIALIPNKGYKRNSADQADMCSICYCDIEAQEQIKDLKCKHLFHVKCIGEWLIKSKLCPNCKMDTSSSIVLRKQLPNRSQRNEEQPNSRDESRPNAPAPEQGNRIIDFANARLEEYMMRRWFHRLENGDQEQGEGEGEEGSTAHFRRIG